MTEAALDPIPFRHRGTGFTQQVDAEAWDGRADRLDHPFLLSTWLDPWFSVFAPSAEPLRRAWDVEHGAPLVAGHYPHTARGAVNAHTPVSGSLSGDGLELPELLPEDLRQVVWSRLDEEVARVQADRLRAAGWLTLVERQHASPVVSMEDSHRVYERRLGKNVRQRARRLERKLVREESAHFVVARPTSDPELFERCLELEAAGWKGRSATAILSHPATETFSRAVARRGDAHIFALEAADALLAFALCLQHRDRLFLLKTAYDERYWSVSPGLVLHAATIRFCHETCFAAYELLGSADPWKLRLANDVRPISRLVADRRSVLGYAHQTLRTARPAAKVAKLQLARLGRRRRH